MLLNNWQDAEKKSMRTGFGQGLVEAGKKDDRIVALTADLGESTQISLFQDEFPDRFIEVGVAEQNLVTVASGLAHAGKLPFAASYAVFSPGRNWEQIRTTICLNDQPVVIVGTHAGVNVGPDGATHQMLEDIALMRSLPNMVVLAPADANEAKLATEELAKLEKPAYLRLSREGVPTFLDVDKFEIGKAYVLRQGSDVSLIGTGTMTYPLLKVAELLSKNGINAEVVHVPTVKPLDKETILESARRCGRVVSAEEGQISAGFGGAIAELLSEKLPTPHLRIGINDEFGESGTAEELLEKFQLTPKQMQEKIKEFIENTPKYHQ